MGKYRVHFMGCVEVEADSADLASQAAWNKLKMEDDIFDVESIYNVVLVNQGMNPEECDATDDDQRK